MDNELDSQDKQNGFIATPDEGARGTLSYLLTRKHSVKERINDLLNRKEEEILLINNRYDQQINPLLDEIGLTETIINGLKKLFALDHGVSTDVTTDSAYAMDEVDNASQDQLPQLQSPVEQEEQKPRGRGLLRYTLLTALKEINEFANSKEVIDFISENHAEENFNPANIRTGLRDAFRSKAVARIVVYEFGVPVFLYGLRSYLDDPGNIESIKEEYMDKLFRKMYRHNLSFDKEPVGSSSPKQASEGQTEVPEKELPSAGTDGSAENDIDRGHPSVYAAGKFNGYSSGQLFLPNSH